MSASGRGMRTSCPSATSHAAASRARSAAWARSWCSTKPMAAISAPPTSASAASSSAATSTRGSAGAVRACSEELDVAVGTGER